MSELSSNIGFILLKHVSRLLFNILHLSWGSVYSSTLAHYLSWIDGCSGERLCRWSSETQRKPKSRRSFSLDRIWAANLNYGSRLNDTPQPNSAQVTLEEIPQHFASVHAYHGDYPSTEKIEEIGKKLLMAMKNEHIQPISFSSGVILDSNEPPVNLRVMSYDPPWTPTFLKLNEISIICGISQMPLPTE